MGLRVLPQHWEIVFSFFVCLSFITFSLPFFSVLVTIWRSQWSYVTSHDASGLDEFSLMNCFSISLIIFSPALSLSAFLEIFLFVFIYSRKFS